MAWKSFAKFFFKQMLLNCENQAWKIKRRVTLGMCYHDITKKEIKTKNYAGLLNRSFTENLPRGFEVGKSTFHNLGNYNNDVAIFNEMLNMPLFDWPIAFYCFIIQTFCKKVDKCCGIADCSSKYLGFSTWLNAILALAFRRKNNYKNNTATKQVKFSKLWVVWGRCTQNCALP